MQVINLAEAQGSLSSALGVKKLIIPQKVAWEETESLVRLVFALVVV